ncbi:MAG: hypothetical protein WD004_02630 [Actinomycetota bacterium]
MGKERRVESQSVLVGGLAVLAVVSFVITLSVILAFFFALMFAIHGGRTTRILLDRALLMWPAAPVAAVSGTALLIVVVRRASRGRDPKVVQPAKTSAES